jgi:hypothetical protein
MRSLLARIGRAVASLFGRRPAAAEEHHREGHTLALRLLQDARVQTELGLSAEQADRLQHTIRSVRQEHRPALQAMRTQERARRRQTAPALMATIAAEVLAALSRDAVLTPEQQARLRQIVWQNRGAAAFADPALQEALGLSGSQKERLRQLARDFARQAREGGRDRDDPGRAERMAALRSAGLAQALEVLSEPQRQRWDEVKGRPFVLRPEEAAAADDGEAE